jgi:HlyD family secretion protein
MRINAKDLPQRLTYQTRSPADDGCTPRGMDGMKSFFSMLFSVRTLIVALVILALAGGGAYAIYYWETVNGGGPAFRTEPVVRRNLLATIPATGTIEPEEVVDVGAQVAGRIDNFGIDPSDPSGKRVIDYCTPVEKDTVLARIDDSLYASRVAQVESALKNAQANVELLKAKKWQADQDLKRADRLAQGAQALAAADYDAAVAADKSAIAAYGVGQASIDQAKANLNEAKINLGYCTITSPVKGVIIDRRVNVGQTVVSSLNAPSLFLIAKDLMRLEVWAAVNEADIGNIHEGEKVTFTVDARPGRVFEGSVKQVRYNATMTQNVVTYPVIVTTENNYLDMPAPSTVTTPSGRKVSTDNQELELLPYQTANLSFQVADRTNALLVPNSALRWRPQLPQVAPEFRDAYEQSLHRRGAAKAPDEPGAEPGAKPPVAKGPPKKVSGDKAPANHGVVWVQEGAFVRPIHLLTDLTDGTMTEIVKVKGDEEMPEGTLLVTGETQAHAAEGTSNPFLPKIFAPKKKKEEDK